MGFGRRSHIGKLSEAYYRMHKRYEPELKLEHNTMCLAVAIVIARAYALDINLCNFLTYKTNYDDLITTARDL